MPKLPHTILHQIILAKRLLVLVQNRTRNKSPVIIDICPTQLSFLIHINLYQVSIFTKLKLRIPDSVKHGNHHKRSIDKFRMGRPIQVVKRQNHCLLASNLLYCIKTGPVRCVIHALAMKKMSEIGRTAEQHDSVRIHFVAMKQLDLLYRIVKLRMHTPHIPFLFIFTPLILLIPCRYKV